MSAYQQAVVEIRYGSRLGRGTIAVRCPQCLRTTWPTRYASRAERWIVRHLTRHPECGEWVEEV